MDTSLLYRVERGNFQRLDFRKALRIADHYGVSLKTLDDLSQNPQWDDEAWCFEVSAVLRRYLHQNPDRLADLEAEAAEALKAKEDSPCS